MTKIKLSKPISAHDEQINELTLREPTGDDVIEVGYPYLILMKDGESTGIEIRPKAIYSYISKLGGIPLSSAKLISLADVATLQGVIMGFFGASGTGTESSSSD